MEQIARVEGQSNGFGWSASFAHGRQKRTSKRAIILHKPLNHSPPSGLFLFNTSHSPPPQNNYLPYLLSTTKPHPL